MACETEQAAVNAAGDRITVALAAIQAAGEEFTAAGIEYTVAWEALQQCQNPPSPPPPGP